MELLGTKGIAVYHTVWTCGRGCGWSLSCLKYLSMFIGTESITAQFQSESLN